jgi:hypothetical protein
LPDACVYGVLQFAAGNELARLCGVNKQWNKVGAHRSLWSAVATAFSLVHPRAWRMVGGALRQRERQPPSAAERAELASAARSNQVEGFISRRVRQQREQLDVRQRARELEARLAEIGAVEADGATIDWRVAYKNMW